jgi:PAS domain S-box-containing protein
MAVCLTDPNQHDEPIIFANRAFRELTGYSENEIVGRNCRFLQGPGTDPAKVKAIRHAIDNEEVIVVELLNYRRDGTSFWNALHLGPIYGDDGKLLYYFGSQWDVSNVHAARSDEAHAKTLARELSHRMKNMFAVIGGIVAITGREMGAQPAAKKINDRIQALGRAYEPTLDEASVGSIDVGSAIRSVLEGYPQVADRMILEGNGMRGEASVVATLGIVLHELATNAIKHGALSEDGGTVRVHWTEAEGGETLLLDWHEETGRISEKIAKPSDRSGLGIIDSILQKAKGRLHRDWLPGGLHARLVLPLSGGKSR